MTNKKYGTLYVGVTSDLVKRVYEHKSDFVDGFTKKYKLKKLVYYEVAGSIYTAICHEKKLKRWHRAWKFDLIEKHNPEWEDHYFDVI